MRFTLALFLAVAAAELVSNRYLDENVTAPTNTCGGNCPSNGCSTCPCGTSPNRQDIASWCAKFSKWNQKQCQCIVSHESGGNGNAVNQNRGGSLDVGFWQVNTQNWASCSGGKPPCDMATNLACAEKVWAWGGNTFKLWSTCKVCGAC